MTLLQSALNLANKGFYIFPLIPGSKTPAAQDWPNLATRDLDQIKIWWNNNPQFNIGIYCGKYNGEGEALIGIDIDNKGAKKGDETKFQLELDGLEFPQTFMQTTPTGGKHLIYRTKEAVQNGVNVLGPGLDIRSKGGYLVGAGSIIGDKQYYLFDFEVVPASDNLLSRLKKTKEKEPQQKIELNIDKDRAKKLALEYLKTAPVAISGEGGNELTFKTICKLKDLGCTYISVLDILEDWNSKCQPPWSMTELMAIAKNAYQYGQENIGSKNPEVIFNEIKEDDLKDPVLELNKEYAFITIGGKPFVLWEHNTEVSFLTVQAFHLRLKSKRIMYNDKQHQISNLWLGDSRRRTYSGVCFDPESKQKDKYNMWRGFSVKPKAIYSKKAETALDYFIEHVRENVCDNNEDHFNWLMGFFAHMIQKPFEKPIVSVVLRGLKGVGKNVLVECIGHLLGPNFTLASNSRYLLGNFNSHLERCLMFVLDEAFWSGNKAAEGTLKDIITGKMHLIERKGFEPYSVKNLTRVFILGNEEWLVPATHDERRFAVFDINPKRRNDFSFFDTIFDGMRDGGYEALFEYLLNFKITVNLKLAPITQALKDQKISSLNVFKEFMFESLKAGFIVQSNFTDKWELEISKEELRQAYRRFSKEKGVNAWLDSDEFIGKQLKLCLPKTQTRRSNSGTRPRVYLLGPLDEARLQWEHYIGHNFDWGEI